MAAPHYSVWLVPQEPDLTYFQGVINTLSSRFGTAPFCPHVTLYSGPIGAAENVQHMCAALAPAEPLELKTVGLAYGTQFSKTLYVQLQPSPALLQLVKQLVVAIPNASQPDLDPHISLLYHRLDATAKQALVDTIVLPRPAVQFNQIQVIAAPENFETQEHVISLRCVHRQVLKQS